MHSSENMRRQSDLVRDKVVGVDGYDGVDGAVTKDPEKSSSALQAGNSTLPNKDINRSSHSIAKSFTRSASDDREVQGTSNDKEKEGKNRENVKNIVDETEKYSENHELPSVSEIINAVAKLDISDTSSMSEPDPSTIPEPYTASIPEPHTGTIPKSRVSTKPQLDMTTIPKPHTGTIPKSRVSTKPQLDMTTIPKPHTATIPKSRVSTKPQLDMTTIPKPHTATIPKSRVSTKPQLDMTTIPKPHTGTIPKSRVSTKPQLDTTTIPKPHTGTIPKSGVSTKPQLDTTTIPKPHTGTIPKSRVSTKPQLDTTTIPKPHTAAIPKSRVSTKPQLDTTTIPKPHTGAIPKSRVSTKPQLDTTTIPKPHTGAIPKSRVSTKPQLDTTTIPKPHTGAIPKSRVSTKPQLDTTTMQKSDTATIPGPDAATVPEPDTATIPEPLNQPKPERIPDNIKFSKVFCDIETSSLYLDTAIVQIAAVCEEDCFDQYILPRQPFQKKASEVTGLTSDGTTLFHHGKPVGTLDLPAALRRFLEWLDCRKPCILIGHNLKIFDYPRIYSAFDEYNLIAPFHQVVIGFVDTLLLFKTIYPDEKTYKQEALVTKYVKETYDAHNAVADVKSLKHLVEVSGRITQQVLCDHSFSAAWYIKHKAYKDKCNKNANTFKALIQRKVISKPTVDKIAASGLKLEHLRAIFTGEGADGLSFLVGRAHVSKGTVGKIVSFLETL